MRLPFRRPPGNASRLQIEPNPPSRSPLPAAPAPPAAGTPLTTLGLSKRPYNALMRSGVKTVEQLAALTPDDIRIIHNVGPLAVDEIVSKLDAYHQPCAVVSGRPGLDEGPRAESPPGNATDDRTPLAELGLSRRPFNALMRGGVKTIGTLTRLSSDEVLAMRNISPRALAEINARLAAYAGLTLGTDAPPAPEPVDRKHQAPQASTAAKPYLSIRTTPPAPPTAAPSGVTAPRRRPSWPAPWPDKVRNERTFMAFVAAAVDSLARRPTVEQFLDDLLAWANRKRRKSSYYKQNVLDACYIVGLIDDVNYDRQCHQVLKATISPSLSAEARRHHCRQAALARLANGPQLLRAMDGVQFDFDRLAARLSMSEAAIENDLSLFRYLGLVVWGPPWRVPPAIAAAYLPDDAPATRHEADARLRACPALLPDRPGTDSSFLLSLNFARSVLETGVTAEEFLRQMITWAGREYPKSETYYQNVLDAYYVVGAIHRTSYAAGRDALLTCCLPADKSVAALREHCIRAALERLEKGPLLLAVAERLGTLTRQDIQSALAMTLDNAVRHIRLFTSLGVLSQQGLKYRLSSRPSANCNEEPVVYTVEYEPASIDEPGPSWEYEDGLETLAFLGGIE